MKTSSCKVIALMFGCASLVGLGYKYLAVTPHDLQTVGNSAILASYTFNFGR